MTNDTGVIARPLAIATGAVCFAISGAALRHWRIAGVAAIGIALKVWPMYGAFFASGTPPAKQDGLLFAARADADLGDRKFRLYGAHLNCPVMPATERVRNAQLISGP